MDRFGPPRHGATGPLSRWATRQGNAYIEYFVIALVVLLATIAFYESHLKDEGVGMRGNIEAAFDGMVEKVLAP